MDWFKAHHDARNDAKLKWIARQTGKPFIEILGWWMATLSLASESPTRGQLYMTPTEPYTLDDISETLHTPLHETELVFQSYEKAGIVSIENGVYVLANWDKRQLKPDYSTPRVQKYRDSKREIAKSETLLKRYSNGCETADETDRKKKEERRKKSTPKSPVETAVETEMNYDPFAEDTEPESTGCPRCSKPSTAKNGVAYLFQAIHDKFKAKFDECPLIHENKDGPALTRIKKTGKTDAQIVDMYCTFLDTGDSFAQQRGYCIAEFERVFNGLAIKAKSGGNGKNCDNQKQALTRAGYSEVQRNGCSLMLSASQYGCWQTGADDVREQIYREIKAQTPDRIFAR